MSTTMNAVLVNTSGDWEKINKELPMPKDYEVRIKIKACGVCHSDSFVKEHTWPGINYPRIPGHEVAGFIDEIGSGVIDFKVGQRVGVGWAGRHCNQCLPCRRGDFMNCVRLQITGINYDGGYAEYMVAPVETVAAIPDQLSFEEAAPLLCAGVTTFNALRHSVAGPGDVVAIQGIGGLGHLAIQFANKMGFNTVAISKGADKEALARKLGAHIYLDGDKSNIIDDLQKLGGAKVILATAPSGKSITPLVDGLSYSGELVIVGASFDPIEVIATQLITLKRSMQGWPSGTAADSEDTMRFCVLTGIRPMIEKFSLQQAPSAYEHMMTNKTRFRAVLTMNP